MELILIFIKYCAIFALIAVAVLVMLFPLQFNSNLDTDSPRFKGNLGLSVIVAVAAGIFARKKAKKRNLNEKDTFCATAAQVLSPLSILFIIFMVSGIMNDIAEKRKKKK